MSSFEQLTPVASGALLRRELCFRAEQYARKNGLPHCLRYGANQVVAFEPHDGGHGNFLPETYAAILANPSWRKRLAKVHSSARTALPRTDRRWCELDSCNSSDALLMNVFCHPDTFTSRRVRSLLGSDDDSLPEFGFRPRVPLASGKFDRTEVDMRLGSLLVEAKLTEADFQSKSRDVVNSYRDFCEIFDRRSLPQTRTSYLSYQLILNVLAAHHTGSSFCVLCDARRPDLISAWYDVMRCVKPFELRTRCKVLTWQELSEALPERVRSFLDEKYGIACGPSAFPLPVSPE